MKHKSTKLLTLSLCFIVIFSMDFVKLGHSQPTSLEVVPGNTVVPVCTTFNIDIRINDVYNLYAFSFWLRYDTTKMDAVSAYLYPPFSSWFYAPPPMIDDPNGRVLFEAAAMPPQPQYSGTGLVGRVTFHCTASGDNTPLTIELNQLLDDGGNPIPCGVIPGLVTQVQPQPPPINVTFRLLAVESYYSTGGQSEFEFEGTGSVDYYMKSGQYLIQTLLGYTNWKNSTQTFNGFKYTTHIHLLSADPTATALPYYKGTPTNSNVVNEIQNFLAGTQTPWEKNNLTIRIFYYCGHSGIGNPPPAGSLGGFFLALGQRGSHPAKQGDPSNPSSYQELWDYQLNQTLNTGDLAKNNCTLIILDSCRSQGAIQTLRRLGRVILTSCSTQELSYGWLTNPPNWPPGVRDRWSFFTGQNQANSWFSNGTNAGPLGIIGAITVGVDANKDGWANAGDIFGFANATTYRYSKAEYPGWPQMPQRRNGVLAGAIPIVQYDNKTAFPYNGKPWDGDIQVQPPPWPRFRHDLGCTGATEDVGPSDDSSTWVDSGLDTNASVVVSEFQAIVATKNGVVYGLDLPTGKEIWRFTAESQILSTPAIYNGTIYVATFGGGGGGGGAGGILYAIDETTGLARWTYQAPTGTGFFASPMVADGYVFVATTSETSTSYGIYALNQTTGTQVWSRLLDTPIKSSPAVKNGLVYVATTTRGSTSARLHAITEFTGVKIWNYSFGLSNLISTPAVGAGQVVIGCMGGGGGGGASAGLYAFQESSGTLLWDFPTSYPVSSSPAIDETNGVVVFGIEAASIYALTLTGSQRWVYPSYGPMKMSSPAISGNGLVYVGMTNKWLLCLDEMSGLSVWSYLTDGPIFSSPAIVDNHVLIGTTGSSVYCFGPPFPEHDVSAKRVFPQQTVVTQDETATIEYTVKNEGNVDEGVTVTIGYRNASEPSYADLNELYVDDFMLAAGTQTTRYYLWDMTDMPAGTYNTTLTAHMIPGEADIADNILVNGSVTIIMPGVHDVAIASVTPAKTVVCQMMTMKIIVEVSNLGAFPETFNVMVAAVPIVGVPRIVGLQQVSLAPAETKVMIFVWQTTGSPIDTYTIEAYADTVPGEEVTANNVRSDGQVKVSILGDINADNIVNIKDATQIGLNWLQLVPPANPNADINDDGVVNIKDATIIGVHWLETYP